MFQVFLSVPTWQTWDQKIAAICGQIHCFRRLQNRIIIPAEFLSSSLPCSFSWSHAAVLGILLIEYVSNVAEVAIFARRRRHRRRQYAPASYTACHVDHEKWNAWVS